MNLIIGISGLQPNEHAARALRCLEQAYPVEFVLDRSLVSGPFDAVIAARDANIDYSAIAQPRIEYFPSPARLESPAELEEQMARMGSSHLLDQLWHNRSFAECELGCWGALKPAPADSVLATIQDRPVWIADEHKGTRRDIVASPLPELGPTDHLRDLFRNGRFLRLFPLLHFIARLCRAHGWSPPPIRATFLIDDPNLHAVRYGHLNLREIAKQSAVHRYSLAVATVPLDCWYFSTQAARLFRENHDRLSLLIHGNDHLREELARPMSFDDRLRQLAQARRRIADFERRAAVEVSPVMAPPHGSCSEDAARAMLLTGYSAACISRPYPWLASPPLDRPLAGWLPAELVAGGLPVIPRYSINKDRSELLFRAWLGQPLVVYGHHGDLAHGLDRLSELADLINGFGEVRWCSLAAISRTNGSRQLANGTLRIGLFSREFDGLQPEESTHLAVSLPTPHAYRGSLQIRINDAVHDLVRSDVELTTSRVPMAGGQHFSIRLLHTEEVDFTALPSPRPRLWPIVRRFLTEGRDRLQPVSRT